MARLRVSTDLELDCYQRCVCGRQRSIPVWRECCDQFPCAVLSIRPPPVRVTSESHAGGLFVGCAHAAEFIERFGKQVIQ